jgi:glycosyltransferase involved in cell wall biosynthesis
MRVLIDTSYALRGPSGTATYILELTAALRDVEGVELVEVANERRRPPGGGGIASVRNLLTDRAWLRRRLPQLAADVVADVLHHPLPALARQPPSRQVITVHDLAFETHPEHFDPRFARWAAHAHRRAAREAAVVICVSEATAREVRERWEVPAERVVVIHHGPGQELPVVAPRSPRHVLYVGDEEPRKNLALLREARLPLPLRESGGVDPPALAELYAEALALVLPSVTEGFGLTPLEAMKVGVPVVARRSPAVEEVCGDAAVFADDRAELEAALQRLHADPQYRAEQAAKGRRRAAGYSWRACARAHVEAYRRALES